jgi:molybdopterin molybdotransferase
VITSTEATQAISRAMPAIDSETVVLTRTPGRILRQIVVAERDQPPFDRVMMDGIAILFEPLRTGRRKFVIQGIQHAGDPVQTLQDNGNCIEIMTGGVRPEGSDCIIPVERISVQDGIATIDDDYPAKAHQFIHPQGSDYRAGHEVLLPGAVISPMDIAIIASCGLAEVEVSRSPVIRVISTGNELVPPGEPVATHQIRMSNGPALVAMLTGQGFSDVSHEHMIDEAELMENRLAKHLHEADVLLLSGGVSMGKADFVPQVLQKLGVQVVFHKISQRPGKPMWFGIGPEKQAVFALPGNPVSTLVCCRQYVLPALSQASGRIARPAEFARLAQDVTFDPDLTCFQPVRISGSDEGVISVTPVATNTSGDFAALGATDGYVELAQEQRMFSAGTAVPLHRWTMP